MVALDIETTGLKPWNGDLPTLMAVYGRGMGEPALFRGRDIEAALKQLEGRDVVIHNAMFDLPMLERYYPGTIRKLGKVYDTLTLSKIAYAGQNFERHGLAECLRHELGIEVSKEQQKSDWSGPLSEEQIEYAKKDVLHLPALLEKLLEKLEDQSKVVELEVDLTPVLADMKVAGVKVDADGWREQAERVQAEIEWVEAQLSDKLRDLYIERGVPEDEADETVDELNWGSLKQVQACLSDVDVWIHSIAGDELKGLDDPTGILGLLQQRQKLVKLRSSYGEKFLKKHISDDGLVHADWVQTVSTGRMSCTEPNLQNIPRDAKNGEKFRRLIVPKEGKKFIVPDYNAIEMRLAAIIAHEPGKLINDAAAGGTVVSCPHRTAAGTLFQIGSALP